MGEEYTYICSECGEESSLIVGFYDCKGWGDPDTRRDIGSGKYGKKAKKALEDNPGCNYHFQADVFQCQCGYVKSYDSLVIHDSDVLSPKVFFMTGHRCPKCKKALKKTDRFPMDMPCHRCGARADIVIGSHMRW
jgi:DNA-directed RNA polymerase subunit RPC12/RpoP